MRTQTPRFPSAADADMLQADRARQPINAIFIMALKHHFTTALASCVCFAALSPQAILAQSDNKSEVDIYARYRALLQTNNELRRQVKDLEAELAKLKKDGVDTATPATATSSAIAQKPAASAGFTPAEPELSQSSIKGLLVVTLKNNSLAGSASQMNATVVKDSSKTLSVIFNQEVGDMMDAATQEVQKFMHIRHESTLPQGVKIELAFADKYSGKDGPSAAVACALMCESIVTGIKLDPNFACTGDMTATGEVQKVGGIEAKLRGARHQGVPIATIPNINKQSAIDAYINQGQNAIYDIQIFTVEKFDEALEIARLERSPAVRQSIDDFALVAKALRQNPNNIKHPKVIEKLEEVLANTPNCVSAEILLAEARGRAPSRLSIAGSLNAIEIKAAELVQDTSGSSNGIPICNDTFGIINDLNRIKAKLDRRTNDYCNAYIKLAQWLRSNADRRQLTTGKTREINQIISQLQSERNKLLNNQEIREELMLE